MAHLVRNGGLDALKSDPFTDFTVRCADKKWEVHRTTLCGDSPVLVLHCTQMMEAEKRELDLHEADPKAVECLLTYQYLGSYEDVDGRLAKQPFVSDSEIEDLNPPLNETTDDFTTYTVPTPPYAAPPTASTISWKCQSEHPPIPTISSLPKSAITSLLLLNISVFELAQRFSLPALESYAISKLLSRERYFPDSHLDKVLALVFDVTVHDDTKLRYPIFLRCVENHATIVKSFPQAVEQLESHASMAWRYALQAQQDLVDRDKEVQRVKAAQKLEVRMQEKASRSETRELRGTIRQRDRTVEYLEEDARDLEKKLDKAKKEARKLRNRFSYWGRA